MDEESQQKGTRQCCKGNRKTFTVLVVTTSLFFLFWNLNIDLTYSNILIRNITSFIPSMILDKNENNEIVQPTVVINSTVGISLTVQQTTNPSTVSLTTFINPHDFSYIILENNTCHSRNGSVFLVVVVCVAPANFKQRMTIRETWGSVVRTNTEIRLIFMIGHTLNTQIQTQIKNESSHYHDIVQENFLDSYRNLTLKSVAMLKWTFTYCPSAQYVLKADDDMFVNLEYLINVLKHRRLKNTVIGMQIVGARPIQDKNSKWYTPPWMFNGSVYPNYCSGTSYVISCDSVQKLYNVSLETQFFWLEDIYITGICRTKANVNIFYDYGFTYDKPPATGCTFRQRITGHRYDEAEIRTIWTELTNTSLTCGVPKS